jgi:hypothetical protein
MNAFTAQSLAVGAQLGLIQTVDNGRELSDPFKLSPRLRQQVDTDLAGLEEYDAVALTMESARTGKSLAVRESLETLERLVREGHAGIAAIRGSQISEPERREVFTAYGWAGGLLGRLSDSRIVGLARLGIRTPENVDPEFHYPADLVRELEEGLQQFDAVQPHVNSGKRQVAVRQRNQALEACEETLTQVRHWYCAASREGTKTKELAAIGFQPRRPRRSPETIALQAERTKARREERAARREEEKAKKQAENLAKAQSRHEKLKAQFDASLQTLARLSGETASNVSSGSSTPPLPASDSSTPPPRQSSVEAQGGDPAELAS